MSARFIGEKNARINSNFFPSKVSSPMTLIISTHSLAEKFVLPAHYAECPYAYCHGNHMKANKSMIKLSKLKQCLHWQNLSY